MGDRPDAKQAAGEAGSPLPQGEPAPGASGPDPERIRPGAFLAFAGVLLGTAVAIHLGLWALFLAYGGSGPLPVPGLTPSPGPVVLPSRLRLPADPDADLAAYRAEQVRRTTTYAWEDRSAGLVRVPVTRATTLLVAHGEGWLGPKLPSSAATVSAPALVPGGPGELPSVLTPYGRTPW